MNTVLERSTLEDVEKEQHNAMISERYRKLLDAVEDVFSASNVEEKEYSSAFFALDNTPTVEQTPTVTEYAPVFTTEKFQRIEELQREVERTMPVATPSMKSTEKATTAVAAHYSLTPLAKIVMAAFTLVVVAMLALIGINSYLLNQRSIRLKNLEEQRQELLERNEEIQARIMELQTEESILERAEQAGLLN